MQIRVLIMSIVTLCFVSLDAVAEPQYYAGTGHYYELVDGVTQWGEAKTEAESQSYLGYAGYLATITSEGENDFVDSTFLATTSVHSTFVGGTKESGNWEWITGESWSYTNWDPGEPSGGGEERLAMLAAGTGGGSHDVRGAWNDVQNFASYPNYGYIVEYPVPESSVLALLVLGGFGLLVRRRKK